jgi:hypothetical protein
MFFVHKGSENKNLTEALLLRDEFNFEGNKVPVSHFLADLFNTAVRFKFEGFARALSQHKFFNHSHPRVLEVLNRDGNSLNLEILDSAKSIHKNLKSSPKKVTKKTVRFLIEHQ